MIEGHFYFIKDDFYNNLPNCNLMANKDMGIVGTGGRPCHYCFKNGDYYWMIPISSKTAKYHRIYNAKIAKYGKCDTIRFGYVNGKERAFLIQNCFPVTDEYIDQEYMLNNNSVPVTVPTKFEKELNGLLRKVITLHKRGVKIVLTDLDKIFNFIK